MGELMQGAGLGGSPCLVGGDHLGIGAEVVVPVVVHRQRRVELAVALVVAGLGGVLMLNATGEGVVDNEAALAGALVPGVAGAQGDVHALLEYRRRPGDLGIGGMGFRSAADPAVLESDRIQGGHLDIEALEEIGRASCRERVWSSVVAVALKG